MSSRILAVLFLLVLVPCCQTMNYQINVQNPDGSITDIYASKVLPPWTEFQGNEITLLTGVASDGSWYVSTGEQFDSLIQNPAIAKAVVDGFTTAIIEGVKTGVFGVR